MALIPLLWDVHRILDSPSSFSQKMKVLFCRGWLLGTVFMGYFHIWIFTLKVWVFWGWLLLLWAAFSVYLGIFFGLAMILYGWITLKTQVPRWAAWVVFPSVWVIAEYARSLGVIGDPGGVLGYSQAFVLPMVQWASITGVFGLSFFCVLINVLGFSFMKASTIQSKLRWLWLIFLLMGGAFLWGEYQLYLHNSPHLKKIPVVIVQGNFTQQEKMNRQGADVIRQELLKTTERFLIEHPESKEGFVFWPEVITPTFNLFQADFMDQLNKLANEFQTTVLFGTPVAEGFRYYNSVAAMTPNGLAKDLYKKVKLMPFGEYWPCQFLLSQFESLKKVLGDGYSAANTVEVIHLQDTTVGMGVCLESVYPWYFRTSAQKGADFLAVALNNGWFLTSFAGDEHFQMSVVRAVENNRYLVLSANTGISAIVTQKGQIVRGLGLNQKGVIEGTVLTGFETSFYTKYGELIVCLSFIFVILMIIMSRNRHVI